MTRPRWSEARERSANAVTALFLYGYSFLAIARRIGISKREAEQLYREWLAHNERRAR